MNKLVRDGILEKLQKDNPNVKYHIIENEESVMKELANKLLEEVLEFKDAVDNYKGYYNTAEELSDVQTALDEIYNRFPDLWRSSGIVKEDKDKRLGTFSKMIFIDE